VVLVELTKVAMDRKWVPRYSDVTSALFRVQSSFLASHALHMIYILYYSLLKAISLFDNRFQAIEPSNSTKKGGLEMQNQ